MQRPADIDNAVAARPLRVTRDLLTLRERAASALRQAIADHHLAPGTHLKERELCELLGVSRTSVREALRHLESEGLVQMVPHKGPVVTTLTLEDARQLYEVRAVLEGLVGELFALKAGGPALDRLKQAAAAIRASARKPGHAETLMAIERFYDVLFEGAGNSVCAQVVRSLNSRIAAFRRLSLNDPVRRREMMRDIDEIVAAAVRRDAPALREACSRHVAAAFRSVERQLSAVAARPAGNKASSNGTTSRKGRKP
jgi:DNA-binding GntR family transcriptional regulator